MGFTTNLDRSNNTWSKANYDKVYRSLEVHDNQVGSGDHLVSKFNYTYNDVGHITKEIAEYGWRQGDVIETDYEYDGLHRLARVTGDPTTAGEADQDSRYEYDSVGNRLEMIEQLKQGDEVRKYDYNPANQLTQINIDSPMYPNLLTTDYSYDNNGNRIDRLVLDESGEDRGVAYSYDTENRLLVAQDYQRQIVQKSNPGQDKKNPEPEVLDPVEGLDVVAGMGSIEGDPVDPIPTVETNNGSVKELIHLAHTDYEYDGNGRRLVATYSPGSSGDPSIGSGQGLKRTEYTFDKLDPVAEYDMLNGQRNNLYRSSAQDLLFYQEFPSSHEASEGQASEQAPNGTKYFYHHDGEGNIAATTKHQGQSDHSYRYDEYGFILPENGNPASNSNEGSNGWIYPHNAYSLSQKQYDGHTNLYYFGSRFYDPEVGVWINQDSYRGTISDPRTLNRYLYNASSPINYVDWYGFDFIVIDRSKAKMYVYDKKNGTLMEEWNVKVGPNTEKGTYELYEWDPYSVDVPGEAIGGSGLIVGTDKPWAKRDKKGFMITDENGVPVVENANNPFGAYAGIMRDSDTGDRIPMQIHGRRGDLTTDPWNCGSDEYSCKYTGQGCIALSNENVINFAENMSWGKDGRKVNTVEIIGEIPTRDEYNAANQPVSSPQPSGGVVSRSWNRLVNWVKSWF
ncbi:MAG: RHS repeat-associated core domain-containing protein [Patescibacteria group bacterium]